MDIFYRWKICAHFEEAVHKYDNRARIKCVGEIKPSEEGSQVSRRPCHPSSKPMRGTDKRGRALGEYQIEGE